MNHWVGISGSWRCAAVGLAEDIKKTVSMAIESGSGIVTGGALGVDQIATETALRLDPSAHHISVILPTSFSVYASHYRRRAQEGVITSEQAQQLIELLTKVADARKGALIEMNAKSVDSATYRLRNSAVVEMADELVAFQVDGSAGTQDAIDKARAAGKPVRHFTYASSSNKLR